MCPFPAAVRRTIQATHFYTRCSRGSACTYLRMVGRCVERRIAARALADAHAAALPFAGSLHDEACGSCDGTGSVVDDGAVEAPVNGGRSAGSATEVFPPEGSPDVAGEVTVEVAGHIDPGIVDAASLSRITNPLVDLASPDDAERSPTPLRGGLWRRGEVRPFEAPRCMSGANVNATDGSALHKCRAAESSRASVDPAEQHLQHHHSLDHRRPAPAAAGPEMLLHVHTHGHSHAALHHDASGASPLLGGSLATRARFVVAAILLEFGVGVHSIFIGLAVGVLSDGNLSALLVALCFHQVRMDVAAVMLMHATHCSKGKWRAPAPLHSSSKGSLSDPASWMLPSRLRSLRLPCAPPLRSRRPSVSPWA